MNNKKPPALAAWMLDHLRSRGSDEALSGDLLEAFRTGGSAGWYWYQVIAAIAIAWGRNVWHHRVTLFFAAVWSVFSPAWLLLPVRFSLDSLVGDTSHIPWPWSFICAIVFGAVIAMLFIWLGVAVYSTFHLLAHGNLSPIGPEGILAGFSGIRAGAGMQVSDRYPLSAASQPCRALGKPHGAWCD